jgi:hypothetical protein
MRIEDTQEISSDLTQVRSVVLSAKVREAMAKMMAVAKSRRIKPTTDRGRFKAAFSPSNWRAGARRWLPLRADRAIVLPDSAASRAVLEAEAKMVADALVRLGPAISRAAVYGLPVTVKAGDPRTAEVFRAALTHTATCRASDRLVRVVVEA